VTNWICVQGTVGASPPPLTLVPTLTRWRSRFEFIDFISSPVAIVAIVSSPLCTSIRFLPSSDSRCPIFVSFHPPAALRGSPFLPSTTPSPRRPITHRSLDLRTRRFRFSLSSPASTPRELAIYQSKQDFIPEGTQSTSRQQTTCSSTARILSNPRTRDPVHRHNALRNRGLENCAAQARLAVGFPSSVTRNWMGLLRQGTDDGDHTGATVRVERPHCSTCSQGGKWMPTYPGLSLEAPPLTGAATSRPSTSPRFSRTTSTVRPRLPPYRETGTLLTRSSADIFVDNVHIELSLWDTAGQEEFDRLRSLSYGTIQPPLPAARQILALMLTGCCDR
jgi:hypothetical protein